MKTGTELAPLPANAWFQSHGNQLSDKSILGKTNTLKSAAAPAHSSNMAWHAPLLSDALCSALPPLSMPWLAAGKPDTKPRGIADHGKTCRLAKQQQAHTQLFDVNLQPVVAAKSFCWLAAHSGPDGACGMASGGSCHSAAVHPRALRAPPGHEHAGRWLSVVAAVWLRGDALSKGLRQELWRYHQPVLAIGQQLEQCLHMPTCVHCHTELHTARCPPGKLQLTAWVHLAACQVTQQETRKEQTHTHGISLCA